MSANNVASTAMTNKDEDSSEHDKDKALCAEINGCYQVPVHDDDDGDGDGAPTLPTAKTRDDHEDSFQTQQPDEHHSRPTEEFDDEGNTIRVENLVFIEGILGQGAFGTVRLARRKFHTNGHCHHGGNGSSSVSVTSVATTPATPFQGHRPRRGFLDKSVSEPRKKSSFFSEKSDYEMQQEANRSSPQTATHLPDDEKKDSNHVSRDTVNASTDTTPAASSRSKSCVTFSTEKSTRSLSPQSRKKPEAQASSPTPSHGQHRFLKHRTASTPIGRRHRGKRFHHHHHHGGKSPSVVGNLGLFTRSRSSMNHYDEFGYDDDEQLVAVKIFSKSILKRKRTMERDKSTKRVKIKTAWQQVEREIALMKKLSHPNLVQMYEVIDSPESDMLYMVLEYMPGGEILTYQNDGTFRRKNPRPAASDDRYKPMEGIVDGHFDEDHAALYFVDILHGLGYLHLHHVCHRDLKPENILLDARGVAKVGDFGVSHIFEKESNFGARRMASIDEHQRLKAKDSGQEKSFSDSWSAESSSSLEDVPEHERRQPKLKRKDTDAALSMRGMAGSGMLSKTEGTWCFWSPEMCEGSQAFSGYAADMWAAGVCLYIFVTGKLPFYSEVPHELFDMIASAEVPYSGLGLSNSLVDLLKRCLEKNPNKRAGVGDCLKHPFLQIAREKRIRQLGEEFEISKKRKIVISDEDIRSAFRAVTSVPVQVLRSAGKKIQESLAHTRDRFSISTSSMSGEGDSFVKHFQEGIHHLRTRLPSMGSTVHSCDEDSITGDNKHSKVWSAPPDLQHPASPSQSKQRAIFFRRGMSDDSDVSLNTFDGSSPVPSEKLTDSEMASPRVSRLSSMRSNSNLTDDVPAALLEVDIEEETERGEDDVAGPADFQSTNTATLETKLDSQDSATLGHRHEAPLGASDRSKEKVDLPLDWRNQKKKRRKGDGTPRCVIQ